MSKGRRKPLSAGSKLMLVLLIIVIAGSAVVLGRLSSGASVDLNKLNIQRADPETATAVHAGETAAPSEKTDQADSTGTTEKPAVETREQAVQPSAGEREAAASFTLTAAGVLCLDGEVRKNSWSSDAKAYDYSDILMLLRDSVQGDVNSLFLENILFDGAKVSDTVAPESAAGLLKEGGFTLGACGFGQAWAKGAEGTGATRMALMERGMKAVGVRDAEDQQHLQILTVNGVRAAFLQYTDTVPAKTRKSMEKNGVSLIVPPAEETLIAEEIAEARAAGAEAVIVMIQWGKTGKAERALAEAVALAGADLIIGGGSRAPEGAEYLTGKDGGSVLCVWNPGSLLTGDRGNVKRTSGYLLHVTVRSNGAGGADVLSPEYTPVYTWKYKQDGRYYYRCLSSVRPFPDGMDAEQKKMMEKSAAAVEEVLRDSPLVLREPEP